MYVQEHKATGGFIAALTCAWICCLAPSPGAANAQGTYDVKSCLISGGEWNPRAFVLANRGLDFTRGMTVRSRCSLDKTPPLGVLTGDGRRGVRKRGARAILRVFAPEGTRIQRVAWRGAVSRERDCGWAMEVYAAEGTRVVKPIHTRGATPKGKPCRPLIPKARLAGRRTRLPTKHVAIPGGAKRIVQRIICKGRGRSYCSMRGAHYITTFGMQLTLTDERAPEVRITGGQLVSGAWVGGFQPVIFEASDNIGVLTSRLVGEGGRQLQTGTTRSCDFSSTTPCPSGPEQLLFDTTEAPREGTQQIAVQAVDAAHNASAPAVGIARIDNTPPGSVQLVAGGGEGWRNSNSFAVNWVNPPEGDRAPIVAAHYRLCRPGRRDCLSPARREGGDIKGLADLAVPGPGEWELTAWREDGAGNQREDNASPPVSLRYDPEVPQLGFDAPPPMDPTKVTVHVKEEISGLSDGQIEISRQGSGTWQALATQREGPGLTARIDDATLPAATYELRARASDQAGNQGFTDRRIDGSPMVLTLPLRAVSTMRAGIVKKRKVRKRVRRRGKRRIVRRLVTRLVPAVRVRFGRRVRIEGQLTNRDGQPLGEQPVYVGARSTATGDQLVAVLKTDAAGRYAYTARASESRTLRFVYLGTGLTLPVQSDVSLSVPAASTLRPSRRRALNGQSVWFKGRLRSLPTPAGGKLVELQVRLPGRWQTFRTVRTTSKGRWGIRYRFRNTVCVQRWRFRLRIPAEAGYPFAPGRSRRRMVKVRGRRVPGCRRR
jgi:hypothetical protein